MSTLSLTVEGRLLDQITVLAFRGTEEANQLYELDIDFTTTATDDALEELLLGRPTTLSVVEANGNVVRSFHGIAYAIEAHGVHLHARRAYRLVLVPRMRLLENRRTRRVFSDMSTLEIAALLFQEHGILSRTRVQRPPAKRPNCVQYDETDLAFLTRLFAEDGLFFTFDHPVVAGGSYLLTSMGATEVVVIGDTAEWYAPIDGSPDLRFERVHAESAMSAREDHVSQFAPRSSIRPAGARVRGYDLNRPPVDLRDEAWLDLKAASTLRTPAAMPLPLDTSTISTFEGSYEATIPAPIAGIPRTVPADANRRLEALRRDARLIEGASFCKRLGPGRTFTVHHCELSTLDGKYVVWRVEHEGYGAEVTPAGRALYQNRFVCLPATVPMRPAVAKDRARASTEVGVVVGPAGQEIYTDPLGRIRVRMPWDKNTAAETGTCWVRVEQLWAGAGFGAMFLPRIGMEVVVTYLDGDPDRPLVTGCVYNATHPPPWALPGDKTRSGVRTQTSPGGGGSHELSFEDEKGKEQVFLHVQGNLSEVVEKNHSLLNKGDEFLRILGNRMDAVEKNLEEHVKGDWTSHVEGNRTSHIDGSRLEVVTGDADERVSGMLATRVEGKERRDVQGTADLAYADDVTTRVKGCMTTLVGREDKKRAWMAHAEGTAKLSSLDSTEVSSEGELVLKVGKSSIRITGDKIGIQAGAVTVKGAGGGVSASEDGLKVASKGDVQVLVDKKFIVQTKDGAVLSMQKEVQVAGAQILLNSPDQAKDAPAKAPDPPTKIELKDAEGKAVAQQRFTVTMGDGSTTTGVTDKDGKAEFDVKSSGKVIFPDVKMLGDVSKGKMMPYVVRQGEYLTRLAFVRGFDVDDVWNDPKNAELKKLRQNPNILHPGDIVYFPVAKRKGLPLQKGTTNTYAVKVPKTSVTLGFKTDKGPRANEPYVVEGLGEHEEGTTDGDGTLTIHVPVHLREVNVAFPKRNVVHAIQLGDIDPIDEASGVRKRLQHLKYQKVLSGDAAGGLTEDDADTRDRQAIVAFQKAQGMPPTGELDDATKAAIVKEHGS